MARPAPDPFRPPAGTRLPALQLVLVFLAVLMLLSQAVAQAQCNTQNPRTFPGGVLRYFTAAVTGCVVQTNNAQSCLVYGPGNYGGCYGGPPCIVVIAVASPAATMSESCVFACNAGCSTYTIDGPNDGLPVELMEFSVEDGEESAEGEPEPDAGE